MRIVIDLQGVQSQSRFRGIGRYSLSIAQAIAKNRAKHEVIIALSNLFAETIEDIRNEFKDLLPQECIKVWDALNPTREIDIGNQSRREVSEILRERFLANLQPDVVLITSLFEGYVDDAVTSIKAFDKHTNIAVISYDLIPLIHQEKYLTHNQDYAKHYFGKIEQLKQADIFLGISLSSCNELVQELGVDKAKAINISGAVDELFRPQELTDSQKYQVLSKYGITKKTIIYTPGGFDIRKNFDNLIKAYAKLPQDLKASYQLIFIGKIEDQNKQKLLNLAKHEGIDTKNFILTGYISDEELVAFYSLCDLFVFASLHEGFGLPILEAMNCGALVIGSNTTSIPEVIGQEDALFDPYDIDSICTKMQEVLTDKSLQAKLLKHNKAQIQKFSWDQSAKTSLKALEDLYNSSLPTKSPKLTMAYISPLPPEQTGIADYSAELLQYLSLYYDIVVVVDQDLWSKEFLQDSITVITKETFLKQHHYDRVLYHFGNSSYHEYMFELIRSIPGVVVLHDFYLGHIYQYMEGKNGNTLWTDALYYSHGYEALKYRFSHHKSDQTVWKFPCNKDLIDSSLGVLLHSKFAYSLASKWYGGDTSSKFTSLAFLKSLPAPSSKEQARLRLGIDTDDFLLCSFGVIGKSKLNLEILEAFSSSKLFKDKKCKLIFVGKNDTGAYGIQLQKKISKLEGRAQITGWIDTHTYQDYLIATDLAIQLRFDTRGESSASALDCLKYGIATILNAEGSMAEISHNVVEMLAKTFEIAELIRALEDLYEDEAKRTELGAKAKEYLQKNHSPSISAQQYYDAIEKFYQQKNCDIDKTIEKIADIHQELDHHFLEDTACALLKNQAQIGLKNLFVDISELVHQDIKTGIQRVVRSILGELLKTPPQGYRIEPVYGTLSAESQYLYARDFTAHFCGYPQGILRDEPIVPKKGDIFLVLDLQPQVLEYNSNSLEILQKLGVKIYSVVYDLLPVLQADFFPHGASQNHDKWLRSVAKYDGVLCISKAVAQEIHAWYQQHNIHTKQNFLIDYFHLGADIQSSSPSMGITSKEKEMLKKLTKASAFLMVGTIEPRKGHLQTLKAFEQLWAQGLDLYLVIAGREGWTALPEDQRRTIPTIMHQLKNHKELDKKLFFFDGASDECLEQLYSSSSALIAASEGEGFGLPLIEAAQKKLPIIARDIPVFQEVAGINAYYFDNDNNPNILAQSIKNWLALSTQEKHPKSETMHWLTWQESARTLMLKFQN